MSSFAEGFADAFIGRVNARKDRIAERVEEQRRMLKEEGLKRQAAMTQQREILSSATARLIGSGMEESKVKALLQEDPRMLAEVAEMGLSGDDLNALIEVKEEYDIDTPLRDLVAQASPAFATITTDPVQKKSNILGRILGFDSEGIMDTEVYGAELLPGVTGAQISASRGEPTLGGRRSGGVGYNFGAIEEDKMSEGKVRDLFESSGPLMDMAIEQRIAEINTQLADSQSDRTELETEELRTKLKELESLKSLEKGTWADKMLRIGEIDPSVLTRVFAGDEGALRLKVMQERGYGYILEPFLNSIEETTGTAPATTTTAGGGEGVEEGTPASGELVVADGEIQDSPRPRPNPRDTSIEIIATIDEAERSFEDASGGFMSDKKETYTAVIPDSEGEITVKFDSNNLPYRIEQVSDSGKLEVIEQSDPEFNEVIMSILSKYSFLLPKIGEKPKKIDRALYD